MTKVAFLHLLSEPDLYEIYNYRDDYMLVCVSV